ncbi:hypothetical protein ANN_04274 [Periplaneta americana]|uniref:PI3K/PI4K catalytic domain-containing protein n=1 Tax=Periplaneta americana TaxID=6978 RepID=A0ABQ8TA11_PERAM|nr:hypothetical protein ANN_04274 [Periplaneta americana]
MSMQMDIQLEICNTESDNLTSLVLLSLKRKTVKNFMSFLAVLINTAKKKEYLLRTSGKRTKEKTSEVLCVGCGMVWGRNMDITTRETLEAFEMWIRKTMEHVKWTDRIRIKAALERDEERMILKLIRREKGIGWSKEVPAWMFLGWVNQLLACLDTPVGPVLYDLVLSLAQTYPQALIYAFPLSREKYNLERRETRLKDLVYQLESILFSNPLVDTFLRAFSCLALPCNMLYYFVVKLTKSLNVGKPNFNVVSQLFDTMMKEIFPDTRKRVHGSAFESVKTFQKQLEKMKPNENPWLSEFQAGSHGCVELEIPGQYTGESKPLLQHHIKIVGFGQNVVPLESLRSPLRITVLGSDAKEHRYLVKYGEDLRQDQRLEQLFNLMNKILNQDPNCRHRRLSITTYQRKKSHGMRLGNSGGHWSKAVSFLIMMTDSVVGNNFIQPFLYFVKKMR